MIEPSSGPFLFDTSAESWIARSVDSSVRSWFRAWLDAQVPVSAVTVSERINLPDERRDGAEWSADCQLGLMIEANADGINFATAHAPPLAYNRQKQNYARVSPKRSTMAGLGQGKTPRPVDLWFMLMDPWMRWLSPNGWKIVCYVAAQHMRVHPEWLGRLEESGLAALQIDLESFGIVGKPGPAPERSYRPVAGAHHRQEKLRLGSSSSDCTTSRMGCDSRAVGVTLELA